MLNLEESKFQLLEHLLPHGRKYGKLEKTFACKDKKKSHKSITGQEEHTL